MTHLFTWLIRPTLICAEIWIFFYFCVGRSHFMLLVSGLLTLGALVGPAPARTATRRLLLGAAAAHAFSPRAARAYKGDRDLYKKDSANGVLSGGGSRAEDVALPQFGTDGKLLDDTATTATFASARTGTSGSVQLPSSWVRAADGGLADPVTGTTASALRLSACATSLKSISDLGRPEQVPLVRALELEPALEAADLVAAAQRTGPDGTLFFEYDLALPQPKCDAELATVCLPQLVILLAAAVKGGQLHVCRLDASPGEWRRAGRALKTLRSSFAVDA